MKTNWPAMRIGCLIFASAALASGPSLAQTQEPAGATATASVISSVAVTQAPQRASVRVEGEGPLEVHAARIQNPDRLVLDFNGARLAVRNTVIPGVSAPVRGVRVGQYKPDVARVVVDLTAAAPYHISREGTTVVISFAVLPESPAALTLVTKVASEDLRGTKPGFRYEMAAPRNVALRSTRATRVSAPRFALPGELTQPSFVLASFGGKNEPARPSAQAAQQQAGNAAATLANSQAAQASPAPTATGRYTGEPISVNLKDVDLKDFFRLIHEISGLNVVLDPAVKGTVTLVLDEVPWDQGLDIVLRNNGLNQEIDGNVLRIATQDTLKREADQRRDLLKAQSDAIETVTATRVLSYAKADAMVITLKKFLTARGDLYADTRLNTLIVRDIPSSIPKIDNLLRQLDRKSQQVEIDARVIQASRSFAREIGTLFAFSTQSGGNVFGGNSAVGTSPLSRTVTPPFSSP